MVTPPPFPIPLNIGTDICQISRIHRILQTRRGAKFIIRVLAPEERRTAELRPPIAWVLDKACSETETTPKNAHDEAYKSFAVPPHGTAAHDQSMLRKAAEFMSGRFAVKEAVMKAHPHRSLGFHDIIIRSKYGAEQFAAADASQHGPESASGPPVAVIRDENGKTPGQAAMVSISHDGDYATAVCLGYDPGKPSG